MTSEEKRSGVSEFIDLLKTKKQTGHGTIVVFAGSAISRRAPSSMPSADSLLEVTLDAILESHGFCDILMRNSLRERIKTTITEASKKRLLPPELFYDSMYEYVGKTVLDVFGCLRNGQPNINHRILIKLLEDHYIDRIITTNFDSLLERSLNRKAFWGSWLVRKRIWKVHGDIDKPDTMVATFRRAGQMLFDKHILTTLKNYLYNSHVLFIGYGGTDFDLIPALVQAKMKSVFWSVFDQDEFEAKSKKKPWTTIDRNCGGIRWMIGDLYTSALVKIEEELFRNNQKETSDPSWKGIQSSLHIDPIRLQFHEDVSVLVLLQILYNTAKVSPSPTGIWDMIGEITDEILALVQPAARGSDKFIRDLHAFRAEAHLQKGEIVDAKDHLKDIIPRKIDDWVQAMVLLNAGVILSALPGDKNTQGAQYFFCEALRIAKDLPNREAGRLSLQGRCHSNLAVLRAHQNRPFEACQHFESAARLFEKEGSLFEHIGLQINQARHFMYLGDKGNALKCFFIAEHELMNFPNAQLSNELSDLEEEISKAGTNIAEMRAQLAGKLAVEWKPN